MVKAAMFSTASDAGLSVQHKFDVGECTGQQCNEDTPGSAFIGGKRS